MPAALSAPRKAVSAVGVEIGGYGDHRLDALADAQRAQMRVHLERDVARRGFVAPELAPVAERHLVGPAARGRQRRAAEARIARRGLDRQRLVGDELAIAGDGQRVVVEVEAVHGS